MYFGAMSLEDWIVACGVARNLGCRS